MNKGLKTRGANVRILPYLKMAVEKHASDLHLVVGRPATIRVDGVLIPMGETIMEAEPLKEMIYEMMTDSQRATFEELRDVDFSYYCLQEFYLRVNIHIERGQMATTIRIMPSLMRSFDELGLPPVVKDLALRRAGLILMVGRAGMGKTTTMNHMVQLINQTKQVKIITIEDPIEYVHHSDKSLIIQREVGIDTLSFASGLKHALRQDPDVIVVGEMRDLDSISMALTAAETGHLVLGTLHSPDAIEVINRIIDVYPGDKQNQIRVQLAENLLAVVGQQLIARKDGQGRLLATEIMVSNIAIRNLIRRDALPEVRGQMDTNRDGMCTMEQRLSDMIRRDLITVDVARVHAKYPDLLQY